MELVTNQRWLRCWVDLFNVSWFVGASVKLDMAALVAGVKFGLSSSGNFVENKELIFVKLTDSAFRAIEDYLKNKVSTKYLPLSLSTYMYLCCKIWMV